MGHKTWSFKDASGKAIVMSTGDILSFQDIIERMNSSEAEVAPKEHQSIGKSKLSLVLGKAGKMGDTGSTGDTGSMSDTDCTSDTVCMGDQWHHPSA